MSLFLSDLPTGVKGKSRAVRQKPKMKATVIKKHAWFIITGTVIAVFLTEILNKYVITFWVYKQPFASFFFPPFPVGGPLILGWLAMAFITVLLSILIIRLRPRTRFAYNWILAWIALGFFGKIINAKVWQIWTYLEPHIWTKLIIPYLNFSIFVPILGYGSTGLVSYWAYKYIIKAFGKGKQQDGVCYMKVDKKMAWRVTYRKKQYYFCSKECKKEFLEKPFYYAQKGLF